MAKKNHIYHGPTRLLCIAFLIVYTHTLLSHEFVEARNIASVMKPELVKHKGTVTTIKREDGDIIDCVDIYKQPAFDHPLLNNHTIEMKPSSYPGGINKPINLQPKMTQSWQKNEQCPEGTIPIRRAHKLDYHRAIPFTRHSPQLHQINSDPGGFPHEYAQVTQFGSNYYGAHARINVWNPKTEISQELSIAQIWLFSDMVGNTNTIEAGWMVLPLDNNDNKTRFFIYWTSDNYQSTGCYNLDCPGFVLTNRRYTIGGAITPVSGYDKTQHEIAITIYKTTGSENWWLMVQDQVLGYWPDSIFTSLAKSASAVSWGGEVMNTKSMGRHTSTQMGSGHFPNEGFGKSSFFRNLRILDQPSGTMKDPEKLQRYVTYPTCYDLHIGENKKTWLGTYFYFGGPGYSDKCP